MHRAGGIVDVHVKRRLESHAALFHLDQANVQGLPDPQAEILRDHDLQLFQAGRVAADFMQEIYGFPFMGFLDYASR
jgi:hypothetical protein